MSQRPRFDPSVSSVDSYFSCLASIGGESEDDDDTIRGSEFDDTESFYTGIDGQDGIIEQDPIAVARFEEMKLKQQVLHDLLQSGIKKPTEFQQRTLVACIRKRDVIAHAEDSKGKKVAAAIAVLQRVQASVTNTCQALILVPDGRLIDEFAKMIVDLSPVRKIKVAEFPMGVQLRLGKKLHVDTHVAVGGPQFMFDAIVRERFKTNSLKMVVIYDATRLLYNEEKTLVGKILDRIRQRVQIISFSRSLPFKIRRQLAALMNRPLLITLMADEVLGFANVRQFYLMRRSEDEKTDDLRSFTKEAVEKGIQTVVICNSRAKVERLDEVMKVKLPDLTVNSVHSGMDASKQSRFLDLYEEGKMDLLIANDRMVAKLDVHSIRLLVNYDLPRKSDYDQSINRNNRNETSILINLITPDDMVHLGEIEGFHRIRIQSMPPNALNIL